MSKLKYILIGVLLVSIILISACGPQDKRTPEQIAQEFANLMNGAKQDSTKYAKLYFLMDPALSTGPDSAKDFVTNAFCNENKVSWIYERTVMQDENTAYAYYTLSTGVIEKKAPGVKLVKTKDGWRVNAFADYFNHEEAETCIKTLEDLTKR